MATSLHQVREMLTDIAKEVGSVGLELHMGKTKVLSNGIGKGWAKKSVSINTCNVEILPPWDATMHLGKNLSLQDMHDAELDHRLAKAWEAFYSYKRGLCDKGISLMKRLK